MHKTHIKTKSSAYRKILSMLALRLLTCHTPTVATTSVWQTQQVEDIPPTTASLIKKQNQNKEEATLKNIKSIVNSALRKEQAPRTHNAKKKQKAKITQAEEKDLSRELDHLLKEQYIHKELTEKHVSLELKRVEIRRAFTLISNITNVNFVIDAHISGIVDRIKFDHLTLGQTLAILCENAKPRLALLREHGLWRIVTKATAIKILTPKALELYEQQISLQSITVFHANWDQEFKKKIEKLWKDISDQQKESYENYVTFDDQSKKIFFKGTKDQIRDFRKIVSELDIKIPQIRIDARVVLAQKDFEETIGIQWSGIYDRSSSLKSTWKVAGVGIGEKVANDGFKDLMNWSLNLLPSAAGSALPVKVPLVFGAKEIGTHRLNLTLNAAENKNEIKTILKPSLLVKSDETAQILVGENMPQDIRLQETVEGQPTNITSISYKDIGMQIKVKPTVSPDQNRVFLDIYVENSIIKKPSFDRTRSSATSTSSFNWTIETSRSQNRVILESGQTTLISGLMVNSTEVNRTGIPILQEIPVIGLLFQGRRKMLVDKQILIFITPTLI